MLLSYHFQSLGRFPILHPKLREDGDNDDRGVAVPPHEDILPKRAGHR